jgi:hypothetical protein
LATGEETYGSWQQGDDLDGHRDALGERGERRAEPVIGENRRVDPTGELAQLAHRAVEVGHRRVEQRARRLRVAIET